MRRRSAEWESDEPRETEEEMRERPECGVLACKDGVDQTDLLNIKNY